ncbi:uncharacterized protein LOC131145517 [Malania oleifera]|uniref:uncharacterized protein LOC131145517 n=1 Tax=Malania oleifera TaxID=397392 RepID=UPI0025AE34C1|nr:uncharacterized protein LOC131145517 [Malania oleifera]
MDLWVFLAATGAGNLVKFWQNLSNDKGSFKEAFSGGSDVKEPGANSSIQHLCDKSCPFGRLAWSRRLHEDASMVGDVVFDGRVSDVSCTSGASAAEAASTSGLDGEKLLYFDNYDGYNACSISSLPLELSRNESLQDNRFGIRPGGDIEDLSSNLLTKYSTEGIGSFWSSSRTRYSLRSRRSHMHFVRPLSSIESCLLAQLYKENTEIKDYVLSFLPSKSVPPLRPLFVTDGSQIINRANGDSLNAQVETDENNEHKETYVEENKNIFGVPLLQKIVSMVFPRKTEHMTGKGQRGRLNTSCKIVVNGKRGQPQVSTDGGLLFCLGISVGIISSFVANEREIEKLRQLLNQTENLVQDLQEELEMKDAITVKELVNGDCDSHYRCDRSFHNIEPNILSPAQDLDKLARYDGKELSEKMVEKDSEHIKTIEAELEAELERLELSMNASALERGFPNLVELDPDLVADVVEGELRADMFTGGFDGQSDPDRDTTGTSTTHTANYAVSPRELSLRLHEVIQSRLEERIRELETALQNSQRNVHVSELKHTDSWRESSDSEWGSSPTHGSPIATEEFNPMAQPLVINLSGEALDAFHEARKELVKIKESEEESIPFGVYEDSHQSSFWGEDGEDNDSMMLHCTINEEISHEISTLEWGSNDVDVTSDENDEDDKMEKLLIQQIVEKTRKGSPAVLNAQKALFSVDVNE